jgi:NAD(P)-dependent dehydrogenase (short-subunit alcohol dehydrogenase family)
MSETGKENPVTAMENKVAVITGGARGVGFGIAQEIIAAGCTAVIVDLNQSDVDQAVAQLGERSSGFVADVTKLDAMEAMYDELISRHGHLDAVVANAGVGNSAPLGSITEEQFDFIFGVNAKGVLFTVQAARPFHRSGGATTARRRRHGSHHRLDRVDEGGVRHEPVRRVESGDTSVRARLDLRGEGARHSYQRPKPRRDRHTVAANGPGRRVRRRERRA